jgi:trehalose 6-phosphate phosphatase
MEAFTAPPSIHPGSKIARATRASRILIATDFGGTLCVPSDDFRHEGCSPQALSALSRLAVLPGVHLAVVSGRGGPELSALCERLPPCWKVSDHGRACVDPQGKTLCDWPSHAGTGPLERAWLQGETLFTGTRAIMQRKRFSVLVRLPVDPSPALQEPISRWASICRSFGLEMVRGRGFVETLVPGFDKKRALVRLSAHLRCDFRVFGGDDGHDLPLLSELYGRPDGLAVFVRSPDRPLPGILVDEMVDGPAGWAAWLADLADLLESRAS